MVTISFQVEDKEVKQLLLKLNRLMSRPEMKQALTESLLLLQSEAMFYAPHWHGDLEESIMSDITDIEDDQMFGTVFTDSPYAVAQERGVPAGYKMNFNNMDAWVEENWGDIGLGALGGYGLASWLYVHGLIPKHFFEQALEKNQMEIAEIFDAHLVEILE